MRDRGRRAATGRAVVMLLVLALRAAIRAEQRPWRQKNRLGQQRLQFLDEPNGLAAVPGQRMHQQCGDTSLGEGGNPFLDETLWPDQRYMPDQIIGYRVDGFGLATREVE